MKFTIHVPVGITKVTLKIVQEKEPEPEILAPPHRPSDRGDADEVIRWIRDTTYLL